MTDNSITGQTAARTGRRTRRQLLTGGAGAADVLPAEARAKAPRTRAANGNPILMGAPNASTSTTQISHSGGESRRPFVTVLLRLSAAALVLSGLMAGAAGPAFATGVPSIPRAPHITVHAISVNLSNWTPAAGFGSRSPGWYTDASGIVHLQGAAKQFSTSGPTAGLLGTLPPAARPSHFVYVIVHTFAGTYADVGIATNGRIGLITPRPPAVQDYSFVSLEGITFKR